MTQRQGVILSVVLCALVSRADAVDVTDCTSLGPREVGVLQNDIVCASGFELDRGATLDLNGFTLSGWVDCTGAKCNVTSTAAPGTVRAVSGMRINLNNVVVDCDGGGAGVLAQRTVQATDVVIENCTAFGIFPSDRSVRVRAQGLHLMNNEAGMELTARGSLKGTDVTISNSATYGVYAGRVVVDGLVADNNGRAAIIAFRQVKLANASVTGSGVAGVVVTQGRVKVADSTITGNVVDLASYRSPKVVDSTCGVSRQALPGFENGVPAVITAESWGVCAGD